MQQIELYRMCTNIKVAKKATNYELGYVQLFNKLKVQIWKLCKFSCLTFELVTRKGL